MFPSTVQSAPRTPGSTASSALKGRTTVQEPERSARAIARRSAEARATIPDLELETTIDAGAMIELARERGCSQTAILVRACALALRESPHVNAAYRDGRFELYSRVNVGVTVPIDGGQHTPTVPDAGDKSLEQLDEEIGRLAARARAGDLTAPELAGATFTVSDLGELGVRRWSVPIAPPQAASLTAGAIHRAAVIRDDRVVAGHALCITLACDHRILFGVRAARFLNRVAALLETGRG